MAGGMPRELPTSTGGSARTSALPGSPAASTAAASAAASMMGGWSSPNNVAVGMPRAGHYLSRRTAQPLSAVGRSGAMSSNAMRDARFCWAGRFCKRLWPFLVAKAVCSTKTAPTQHNDGVNCDQLVRLLEPIAQPTPVFRPFFARSPKVLTKRFTWHPKTSRGPSAHAMARWPISMRRLGHIILPAVTRAVNSVAW